MSPTQLTGEELGTESATMAKWKDKDLERSYKSLKNTKSVLDGHFTRKRNQWDQALSLWIDEPDSLACMEAAEKSKD